ncbi:hypothetical protein P4K96_22775 [Bacillus cereus]|nr:hypothetical protein [Bacillus cereus]
MNEQEMQKAQELTKFDNAIIEDVKGVKELTREAVTEKVMALSSGPMYDVTLNQTVNRIMDKVSIIHNEYFRWWELLIAILIAVIGFYIPLWILQLQRKLRAMEMQNEVDQFHVLISILSEFERISVETVLEWMERYSIIFKPALQRCLLNFDSGAAQALQELREEAPFESFDRIVKRLLRAVEKIPLKEAFDDLEMEQGYYAKMKEDNLERLIRKKSSWGRIVGFTPCFLLIFLYLVFPFLYMSFGQLGEITKKLQIL